MGMSFIALLTHPVGASPDHCPALKVKREKANSQNYFFMARLRM